MNWKTILILSLIILPIIALTPTPPTMGTTTINTTINTTNEENQDIIQLPNYITRTILDGDAYWVLYDTVADSDDHALILDDYIFTINVTDYELYHERQEDENIYIKYYLAKGNLEVNHVSGWHVSVPLPTMKFFILIFARTILNCHINTHLQMVAMTPTNTFTGITEEKDFYVYVRGETILEATGSFLIINYIDDNILVFRKEWDDENSVWLRFVDVYSFEGNLITTIEDYYENGTIRLVHEIGYNEESVELYVLEGEEWHHKGTLILASDNSTMGIYVSPLSENYYSAFFFDNTYTVLGFECPSIFSLATIPNATLTQTATTNTSIVYFPEFSFPARKPFGLFPHSFSATFKIQVADEIYYDPNTNNLYIINLHPWFDIKYSLENETLNLKVTFKPLNEVIEASIYVTNPPPVRVYVAPITHYTQRVIVYSEDDTPYVVKTLTGDIIAKGKLTKGYNFLYLPPGIYVLETPTSQHLISVSGFLTDWLRANIPNYIAWTWSQNTPLIIALTIISVGLIIATKRKIPLLIIPLALGAIPIIHFITISGILAII